jgi:hypothetical protein
VTTVVDELAAGISDPTDSGKVAVDLVNTFVAPVLASPIARPRANAVSLLLPGPPGSRKTSLVRNIAAACGWPLLTVSPPTFLMEGLNGFERRAAEVLTDLNHFRCVVISFDECEELSRDRQSGGGASSPQAAPATRTAGAFITAGMLPRLQALHDNTWVLFFLATNARVEDSRRGGDPSGPLRLPASSAVSRASSPGPLP